MLIFGVAPVSVNDSLLCMESIGLLIVSCMGVDLGQNNLKTLSTPGCARCLLLSGRGNMGPFEDMDIVPRQEVTGVG